MSPYRLGPRYILTADTSELRWYLYGRELLLLDFTLTTETKGGSWFEAVWK